MNLDELIESVMEQGPGAIVHATIDEDGDAEIVEDPDLASKTVQ